MSRYDGSDSYTYPDSDVLKNKGNLTDQDALDAFEADAATFQCVQAANLNALKADIAQGKADIESGCTSKLDIAGIKQRGRDTLAARS